MPTPLCLLIAGPTAGGKSELAMQLARTLPGGGEIICADSMQVWRGMDIGTAKPTADQQTEIPHHALDLADPHRDTFTAATWHGMANDCIEHIQSRGRWPIVVGGTNLYLRLLMEGMVAHTSLDPLLRQELNARETGSLRMELEKVDPATAASLHPNDRRRTIRALEIRLITGTPASETRTQWNATGPRIPDTMKLIGLDWSVPAINARIHKRIHHMIDSGWQDEVHRLLNQGPLLEQPMEALGYRELVMAAEGRHSLAQAIELIKVRTRRLAKQQRSWLKKFRVSKNSFWISADQSPEGSWAANALGMVS